jgi:hypothetical protein
MRLLTVHQGLGRENDMSAEMSELSDEPIDLPLSVGKLCSSVRVRTEILDGVSNDQLTLGAMRRLSISSRLFAASSSWWYPTSRSRTLFGLVPAAISASRCFIKAVVSVCQEWRSAECRSLHRSVSASHTPAQIQFGLTARDARAARKVSLAPAS